MIKMWLPYLFLRFQNEIRKTFRLFGSVFFRPLDFDRAEFPEGLNERHFGYVPREATKEQLIVKNRRFWFIIHFKVGRYLNGNVSAGWL